MGFVALCDGILTLNSSRRWDNRSKRVGLDRLAVDTVLEKSVENHDFGITQSIHMGVFKHAVNAATRPFNDVYTEQALQ